MKIAGQPSGPLLTTVSSLPPVGDLGSCEIFDVPTIEELGYENVKQVGNYIMF